MKPWLSDVRRNASRKDLAVLAVLVLVVCGVVTGVLFRPRRVAIHVVNGLDTPAVVSLGGRDELVMPQTHVKLVVRPGLVNVTAKVRDRNVESFVLHADPHAGAVVYNILGAAPVLLVDVVYSASRSAKPDVRVLAGDRVFTTPSLDFAFSRPPQTVSTKSRADVHKHGLLLGGMENKGNWTMTVGHLLGEGRSDDAHRIVGRVMATEADPTVAASYASRTAARAHGDGGGLPLLAGVLEHGTKEGREVAASGLTWEGCRLGLCPRATRLVAQADLDDASRALAELRTLGGDAFEARLAALERSQPTAFEVQRSVARHAAARGDWTTCLAIYEKLGAALPAYRVPDKALCAFGAGREDDARAMLEKVATGGGEFAWGAGMMLARLDRARGKPLPEKAADRVAGKLEVAGVRTLAALEAASLAKGSGVGHDGLDKDSLAYMKPAVDAARAATTGADAAMAAFDRLGPDVGHLPEPLLVVVAGEAVRVGDFALASRLLEAAKGFGLPTDEVIAWILDGTPPAHGHRLDAEERAALDLARARRLASLGKDVVSDYASIRRRDVLKGWVSRLLADWAAPSSGKDPIATYRAR